MTQTPQASSPEAYQIKVTLVDSAPEVWRRVVIPAKVTLADLHRVMQLAMGWENLHDYSFQVGLGADRAMCEPTQAVAEVLVCGRSLYYTYDLKSGWLHKIELEALDAAPDGKATLPICIAGESACPPEGTGGVWGFEEMLLTLEDPEDPNYLDMLDKYGEFDPLAFRLDEVNRRLARL